MQFSLNRREVIGIALVLVLFCALSLALQPEPLEHALLAVGRTMKVG